MASKPATEVKLSTALKTTAKKSAKPVMTAAKNPSVAAPRTTMPKTISKAARVAAPKKATETVTLKTRVRAAR